MNSNQITSQKEAIKNLFVSIGIPFENDFNHLDELNCQTSEFLNLAIGESQILKTESIPVLAYLSSNHEYYLNTALPTISLSFWNALQNNKDGRFILDLCSSLFTEFSIALNTHIEEEETIFNLLKSNPENQLPAIKFFSVNHHNESSALESIIDILNSLRTEKTLAPQNILTIQLQNLVNELKIHTFVEERILLPILLKS
jgi:iron-sulfur cluster repair protein YtfE (RIC family)